MIRWSDSSKVKYCQCWIRDKNDIAVRRCGEYDDNGIYLCPKCAKLN